MKALCCRICFFVLALWVGFPGTGFPGQKARHNTGAFMGINLSSVSYWSTELPFKDLFKHSQPWVSQMQGKAYGSGGPLALSADGWIKWLFPGQSATTLMCRGNGNYPAGKYIMEYEGAGEKRLLFDAATGNLAAVESSSPSGKKLSFNIHHPSSRGIGLVVKQVDALEPLQGIHIVHSDYYQDFKSHPFQPAFLERWAGFRVIRFMDWMRTNNSVVKTWKDRPTPEMQTQGGDRGVALEYMIQLANTLHADPWFCMPHMADDDYVRRFASMVKQDLDPDLNVYVEYTNEAWNTMFAQNTWCRKRGRAMGLSRDAVQAGLFYYAKRAGEMFDIWESCFDETNDKIDKDSAFKHKDSKHGEKNKRLFRVLSSQFSNPWTARQVLRYVTVGDNADALAVAPYFGGALGRNAHRGKQREKNGAAEYVDILNNPKATTSMTVDEILDYCEKDIERNYSLIREHTELAAASGLALIAYEGGQHLVGVQGRENDDVLTHLFHRANRHPRMETLYLKDLHSWRRAGGQLFVSFASMTAYNKWGSWGLLEAPLQTVATAPKYRAVMRFIESHTHPEN